MVGDRLVRATHHALVLFIVVASVLVLSAQAVVDPRYVEFTASTDHNTLTPTGTAVVAGYSLTIYPQGSSVPTATVNLGKPTPGANNVIRVDFLPLLPAPLAAGVNFEARVSALGPGGDNPSAVSNGFSFTGPCAPAISPASRSVVGERRDRQRHGDRRGCAWSAVSNAGSWLTITAARAAAATAASATASPPTRPRRSASAR